MTAVKEWENRWVKITVGTRCLYAFSEMPVCCWGGSTLQWGRAVAETFSLKGSFMVASVIIVAKHKLMAEA